MPLPIEIPSITLALDPQGSNTGFVWLLVGVSTVIVFFVAIAFFSMIRLKTRRVRKLSRALDELKAIAEDSRRRISLIDKHARDYFKSMSAEAHLAFNEAQNIVNGLEQMIEKLEVYVGIEDLGALFEAEEILSGQFALNLKPDNPTEDDEDESAATLSKEEWDIRLNALFDIIGRDIKNASDRIEELRARKRSRHHTIDDLVEAGIHFVNDKGKKISSIFKSPFNHPPRP